MTDFDRTLTTLLRVHRTGESKKVSNGLVEMLVALLNLAGKIRRISPTTRIGVLSSRLVRCTPPSAISPLSNAADNPMQSGVL